MALLLFSFQATHDVGRPIKDCNDHGKTPHKIIHVT